MIETAAAPNSQTNSGRRACYRTRPSHRPDFFGFLSGPLAFCVVAVGVAIWAAGCSPVTSALLNPFRRPAPEQGSGLRSFLGVSFGDSLADVRTRYPSGTSEASPLGYPAYHLEELASDGIKYPDVVYEFSGEHGMQVVIARFTPSADDAVLERLRRLLGEPTQHTLTIDQKMAEAVWRPQGGEEVRYDRYRHLLSVVGTENGKFKDDVQLRLENTSVGL